MRSMSIPNFCVINWIHGKNLPGSIEVSVTREKLVT